MTEQLSREMGIRERRTPQNKQMGVALVKNTALYAAQWEDGGELPAELKNAKFTTIDLCDKEIRKYLERVWDEHEKKQAKSTKTAASEG